MKLSLFSCLLLSLSLSGFPSQLVRQNSQAWGLFLFGQSSQLLLHSVISKVSPQGTRSGFHSSQALTILSSLPDHLVGHVCGLGHLGGVEHQIDVVVHCKVTYRHHSILCQISTKYLALPKWQYIQISQGRHNIQHKNTLYDDTQYKNTQH